MSFSNLLNREINESSQSVQTVFQKSKVFLYEKEKKKPEEILRSAGFKIKLVTPTSFGTQIDFAKQYDNAEIKDILKDYTIKIKNKSVFIID